MRNKYILLEMNRRNEIRADVNMTIKNMELTELENMNVKIDTGCPYTSMPILKLGISSAKAQQMKQRDCADDRIRKEISFGYKVYLDRGASGYSGGDCGKCSAGQVDDVGNDTLQNGRSKI